MTLKFLEIRTIFKIELIHSRNMIIPSKIRKGDVVRVISPARSLTMINEESRKIAKERFNILGLKLTFSKHAEEKDRFWSSSIKSRLNDIHDAFQDPAVTLVITTIGGFNSNQLLSYLDYKLIKENPKILCGYSDITALANAIYAKTGLVTYSGPHYSSFGEKLYFDYTIEYFKKCLFYKEPFEILPSQYWSNDRWYTDQNDRKLIPNEGFKLINEGEAEGVIVGGNQRTLHYLVGTEFFPSLEKSILFIEEDSLEDIYHFDSHLTALSRLPDFNNVKGIVIGRFELKSKVKLDDLILVIKNNKRLDKIPVIYGFDFGHTDPKITFPIGGTVRLVARKEKIKLEIIKH